MGEGGRSACRGKKYKKIALFLAGKLGQTAGDSDAGALSIMIMIIVRRGINAAASMLNAHCRSAVALDPAKAEKI